MKLRIHVCIYGMLKYRYADNFYLGFWLQEKDAHLPYLGTIEAAADFLDTFIGKFSYVRCMFWFN